MMAALLFRVPTLAFEPNAVPGLANRLVGKRVSAAAVNFEQTRSFFRNARGTGIPVRREFFAVQAKMDGPRRLLVFGGSQGARVLNELMPRIAGDLLARVPDLTILHQAGGKHGESTSAAYRESRISSERVRVQPYLDDMADAIAAADLVLCRSGASTVAELAAAGKASLLVPFAAAADDHQRKNAEVLVAAGAARMITEADLTPERTVAELEQLFADRGLREQMGAAARLLAHRNAAAEIARMCVALGIA